MKIRIGVAAITLVALVACSSSSSTKTGGSSSGGTSTGGSPAPSGGVASIGLQASDAPSGLSPCSAQTGDTATSTDSNIQGEWSFQKQHGAVAGFTSMFSSASSSCTSFILATNGGASGKVIGSVVVQFKDAASAAAASSGLFGASSSQIVSQLGGTKGSSTGLGANATLGYKGTLGVAVWQKGAYDAAVVVENLPQSDLVQAATTINARIP